jgi:hypothetical protein
MNPYKAAIELVQQLFTNDYMPVEGSRNEIIRDLVKEELRDAYEWISSETNGLTSQQILMAHNFPFEGGADGRRTCDACHYPAMVHMLVTRHDNSETKEVFACKSHMLDPGPLLDW